MNVKGTVCTNHIFLVSFSYRTLTYQASSHLGRKKDTEIIRTHSEQGWFWQWYYHGTGGETKHYKRKLRNAAQSTRTFRSNCYRLFEKLASDHCGVERSPCERRRSALGSSPRVRSAIGLRLLKRVHLLSARNAGPCRWLLNISE